MNIKEIEDTSQNIYIIMSSTETRMGKIIQYVTGNRYNHLSLSMDSNLRQIYSFSRYNYSSPLVGGFVEESVCRFCYKSKRNIIVKVYKIPLTTDKYCEIEDYVKSLLNDSNQYIYNTFSALAHVIGKRKPVYKAYTCVEFIGQILKRSGIDQGIDYTKIASIHIMDRYIMRYCIYEGNILKFTNPTEWGNDHYLKKVSIVKICLSTMQHFYKLSNRMIVYR